MAHYIDLRATSHVSKQDYNGVHCLDLRGIGLPAAVR